MVIGVKKGGGRAKSDQPKGKGGVEIAKPVTRGGGLVGENGNYQQEKKQVPPNREGGRENLKRPLDPEVLTIDIPLESMVGVSKNPGY